jgi:hypothetical protein
MTPCLVRQGTELESFDNEAVSVLKASATQSVTARDESPSVLTNIDLALQICSVFSPYGRSDQTDPRSVL